MEVDRNGPVRVKSICLGLQPEAGEAELVRMESVRLEIGRDGGRKRHRRIDHRVRRLVEEREAAEVQMRSSGEVQTGLHQDYR